jgi:hypothetical protein
MRLRNVQRGGRRPAHADRVAVARCTGAAVGVAAVHEHGPADPARDPLAVEPHRCCLDLVAGEDAGNARRHIGHDQAEIAASVLLDAGGNPGGLEPWAWNDLHRAVSNS